MQAFIHHVSHLTGGLVKDTSQLGAVVVPVCHPALDR